jgi:hypothetical protein
MANGRFITCFSFWRLVTVAVALRQRQPVTYVMCTMRVRSTHAAFVASEFGLGQVRYIDEPLWGATDVVLRWFQISNCKMSHYACWISRHFPRALSRTQRYKTTATVTHRCQYWVAITFAAYSACNWQHLFWSFFTYLLYLFFGTFAKVAKSDY